MAKRANEIIAETFGMDVAEVRDARYQETRTLMPVYAIGDCYYCCPVGKDKPPKGWDWMPHSDQFFASRENRVIYVAGMGD